METYETAYQREEDELLWEIHEIRKKNHDEKPDRKLTEINHESRQIFESWKRRVPEYVKQ
jgi:hypothetical protein